MAGRRALHRGGRRLHVQLRDRQRDGHVHRLHDFHRQGRGDRRHARRLHLLEAQGEHARPLDARSCPSTSGARSTRPRPRRGYTELPADRRLGPLPDAWSGRRASSSAWRPTRTTGRARPRSTRSSSRPTRTATRWRRISRRAPSRAPGTSRRRSSTRSATSPISRRSRRSPSATTSSASTAPTRRSTRSRPGTRSCTDPAFRRALQWAVDKDKIVEIGYNGNANAADTIITKDFYAPDADYHWTPEEPYTFDLERAKQELDAAGYTDNDGNGIREYKGKDIEPCACTRAPSRSRARTAAS